MSKQSVAVMWFRSDLRVLDNPALSNCSLKSNVVALFMISKEWKSHDLASCKVDFILRNLYHLKRQLKDYGIPLYIRYGSFLPRRFDGLPPDRLPSEGESVGNEVTPDVILQFCRTVGASSLHFNREYELDETQRDMAVEKYLNNHGIKVFKYDDQCICPPGEVLNKDKKAHTVFTPFRDSLFKVLTMKPYYLQISASPSPNTSVLGEGDDIPDYVDGFELDTDVLKRMQDLWPAGEKSALAILSNFISSKVETYKDQRDLPGVPGTSSLSPYLSVGAVSVRQCIAAATKSTSPSVQTINSASPGVVQWISELCWRDFFRHIVFHFPHVCKGMPLIEKTNYIEWRDSKEDFQRWCTGTTGYPIVDAGMRQLLTMGWMHNRTRMIVASFLTKDLLIDWRWGEEFFMKHLIDGDFAQNNSSWQWTASTGTDPRSYSRIFNPVLQSEKNDPNGDYIKTWVPELAKVETKHVHNPYKTMPASLLSRISYPKPMIDHYTAKERATKAFKKALGAL